jgi:hypothetical protein
MLWWRPGIKSMSFALTLFLGQTKPTNRFSARADGLVRMWEDSQDRCFMGGLVYDTAHFGGV